MSAHEQHHHHVSSWQVYAGVFGALLFLTVVTVAISLVDLGPLNMLVAMGVATVKALLVALLFMQLKYDEKLNGVVFGFGLIFVGLFFIFTLADVFSRGYIEPEQETSGYTRDQVRTLQRQTERPAVYQVARPADETPPSEVPVPASVAAPATLADGSPAPMSAADGTTGAPGGPASAPGGAPSAPASAP